MFAKAVDASAGGTFLDGGTGSGTRLLAGFSLIAAAADATVVIKETDNSGRILAQGAALAKTSDHFTPAVPIPFGVKVFVVVTGASATVLLYEG